MFHLSNNSKIVFRNPNNLFAKTNPPASKLRLGQLPDELIHRISFYLCYEDIMNLGLSDDNLSLRLWKSDKFWALKYKYDFEETAPYTFNEMNQIYRHSHNIVKIGHYPSSPKRGKFKSICENNLAIGIDDFLYKINSYSKNSTKLIDFRIKKAITSHSYGNMILIIAIDLEDRLRVMSYVMESLSVIKINDIMVKDVFANKHKIWLLDIDDNLKFIEKYKSYVINDEVIDFKVKQISVSDDHILVIDMDNNVWSRGKNKYGQLGLGHYRDTDMFEQIKNIKAKDVVAYDFCSFIIGLNNKLYGFGSCSAYHQLGSQPTKIKVNKQSFKAKYVYCQKTQVMAIDLNNYLWRLGHDPQIYTFHDGPNKVRSFIEGTILTY